MIEQFLLPLWLGTSFILGTLVVYLCEYDFPESLDEFKTGYSEKLKSEFSYMFCAGGLLCGFLIFMVGLAVVAMAFESLFAFIGSVLGAVLLGTFFYWVRRDG